MTDKEIGVEAGKIAHKYVVEVAEKHGLDLDNMMKRLAELTRAKTTKVFNPTGNYDENGIITKEIDDNSTSLSAVKFVFDIRGDVPSQKLELSGGVNVSQEMDPLDRELLQFYMTQKREEFEREHSAELQRQYNEGELETP